MRLFGVLLVQDEADVIRELLDFLRTKKYFERIALFDLGSKDETFDIACQYPDVVDAARLDQPYSGALRLDLLKKQSIYCCPGDWLAIVDADEFYAEDPREVILEAEREGASRVETTQAMYYLTISDLPTTESPKIWRSIIDRCQHYIINWSEMRFYKFIPPETGGTSVIDFEGPLARRRVLNRHYPYRSPEQIQRKIEVRLENRRVGGNTQFQIFSRDWHDYIVDEALLHRFDGTYRFGLPDGVDWRKFYNWWDNTPSAWKTPALNNIYVYWLIANGYLPPWTPIDNARRLIGKLIQFARGRQSQRGG